VILRPEEIRGLEEGHALVLAENGKPIIARLTRCIDGKAGRRLLADQKQLRTQPAETASRFLRPRTEPAPPSPRRNIAALRLIRSPTYDRSNQARSRLDDARSAVPPAGEVGAICLS
jgi:hypothetical protein